ncbi:unnamed protein product [Lampetra fluviatilis]
MTADEMEPNSAEREQLPQMPRRFEIGACDVHKLRSRSLIPAPTQTFNSAAVLISFVATLRCVHLRRMFHSRARASAVSFA